MSFSVDRLTETNITTERTLQKACALTIPDFWNYQRTHHGQPMTMLYYVRLPDGRMVWLDERQYREHRRQVA